MTPITRRAPDVLMYARAAEKPIQIIQVVQYVSYPKLRARKQTRDSGKAAIVATRSVGANDRFAVGTDRRAGSRGGSGVEVGARMSERRVLRPRERGGRNVEAGPRRSAGLLDLDEALDVRDGLKRLL